MNKIQWVVYFESANYTGYGEHAIVWAKSEDAAMSNTDFLAYAEDFYREQDLDQFVDEYGTEEAEEASWATVMWAVPYEGSEFVEFATKQPDLFPIFAFKD